MGGQDPPLFSTQPYTYSFPLGSREREREGERTRYRSGRKAREVGGMGEGHKVQRRDGEERKGRQEEVKRRRGKERVTAALEKYIKHCS